MTVVVVGGHSRDIGKTSVVAGLIANMKSLSWAAVKITQHDREGGSLDAEPWEFALANQPFVLSEEEDACGPGDTCRFLAAGARRAFWLRVRQGQIAEALPALRQALSSARYVMIESNSILQFLKPTLYLLVLDSSRSDFKASARQFLERADALVPVESRFDVRAWPGLDPRLFEAKPVFPVSPQDYSSPELCDFVRRRLRLQETEFQSNKLTHPLPEKEQPWQH